MDRADLSWSHDKPGKGGGHGDRGGETGRGFGFECVAGSVPSLGTAHRRHVDTASSAHSRYPRPGRRRWHCGGAMRIVGRGFPGLDRCWAAQRRLGCCRRPSWFPHDRRPRPEFRPDGCTDGRGRLVCAGHRKAGRELSAVVAWLRPCQVGALRSHLRQLAAWKASEWTAGCGRCASSGPAAWPRRPAARATLR